MVAAKSAKFVSAYERAGLWARISFSWAHPLIHKGWHNLVLGADDARFLMPDDTDADALASKWESAYAKVKVRPAVPHRKPMINIPLTFHH